MFYVNWHDYISEDLPTKVKNPSNNSVKWKDPITKTYFFLSKEDFSTYYEKVKNLPLDNDSKSSKLVETFPYIKPDTKICTLKNAYNLYILFSYLYNKDLEDKNNIISKSKSAFFDNNTEIYPKAWNALNVLLGKDEPLRDNIEIKILKGTVYKIKKYMLENNKIKDIRGASTIIKYLSEQKIPMIIKENYIHQCLIYTGGGNIFCILPKNADDEIAMEMENVFHEYAIGLQNVFCVEKFDLKSLLIDYQNTINKIEIAINNRKGLKLYNSIKTESQVIVNNNYYINDEKIDFNSEKIEESGVCKLCKVRETQYEINYTEPLKVCSCCLIKHSVGKKGYNYGYYKDYENYTNEAITELPNTLEDIKDKETNDIAVVFGDGNNMGAIVQNLKSLDEMMYFSQKVKSATNTAVYKSISEKYQNKFFEIIALGGDDIFLFVPAGKSLDFSIRLIELYNKEFENLTWDSFEPKYSSTMSIGIGIGNYKTPVRLLFELSEKALKNAKQIVRNNSENDEGSIDIFILGKTDTNNKKDKNKSTDEKEVFSTLLPYSLKTAKSIQTLISSYKNIDCKTNLNNLKSFFDNSESIIESQLFYCYNQAKDKQHKINSRLMKTNIHGYKPFLGYLEPIGSENKLYSPWGDILNLWEICGGNNK